MDIIIDPDNRRQGATAQASHSLEIEAPVLGCLPVGDTELTLHGLTENLPSTYVASCSQTDLDGISARFGKAKLRIESGHTEDLILGDLQESSDVMGRILRDIPKSLLNPLENRDQISLFTLEFREYSGVTCAAHRTSSRLRTNGLTSMRQKRLPGVPQSPSGSRSSLESRLWGRLSQIASG